MDAVWQALLEQVGDTAPASWISQLQPASLHEGQLILNPAPGRRDLLRFVNDARKQQLAELLRRVTGKSLRISVELASEASSSQANQSAPDATRSSGRSSAHPSARASGPAQRGRPDHRAATPARVSGTGAHARGRAAPSMQDLAQAHQLPLVKQILENFDASVIDFRPAAAQSSAASTHDHVAPEAGEDEDAKQGEATDDDLFDTAHDQPHEE